MILKFYPSIFNNQPLPFAELIPLSWKKGFSACKSDIINYCNWETEWCGYGGLKPEAATHICDGIITAQAFQDRLGNDFTVNWMLNADGTTSITQENTARDSGIVTLTKK